MPFLLIRRKFSLIELLLVFAILAVLASMLQPALYKTFTTARALACTKNEKMVFQYMLAYLDDNSGFYTPATKTDSNQWYDQLTYDDYLSAYDGRNMTDRTSVTNYYAKDAVGGEEVYRCTEEELTGWRGQLRRTYALNRGGWDGRAKSQKGIIRGYVGAGLEETGHQNDVPTPSMVFLFVEMRSTDGQYAAHQNIMSGGQNGYYAYCDNPGFQSYGMWNRGTEFLAPWHDDAWNYLFADGHVERLTPFETISDGNLKNSSGYWTKKLND